MKSYYFQGSESTTQLNDQFHFILYFTLKMQNKEQNRYYQHQYDKTLFMEYKSDPQVASQFKQSMKDDIFLTLVQDWSKFTKNVPIGCVNNMCSKSQKSRDEITTFSGSGSYLYLYIKMYKFIISLEGLEKNHYAQQLQGFQDIEDFHKKAFLDPEYHLNLIKQQQQAMLPFLIQKDNNISFFMSNLSLTLMMAEISIILNEPLKFQQLIQKFEAVSDQIKKKYDEYAQELLYGVPGFIYMLVYLQKLVNDIPQNLKENFKIRFNIGNNIHQLCSLLVNTGIINAGRQRRMEGGQLVRLVYTFYDREYVGGAHGLLGILQVLMLAYEQNQVLFFEEDKLIETNKILNSIKNSMINIISFQQPSGNFPSGFKLNTKDILQQFCHGAPGAVAPLLKAYGIWKDKQFLDAATKAAQSIWTYGLLLKGPGLCHGIPGNAYSFLRLYQETQDLIYLQYAWKFLMYKKDADLTQAIRDFDFDDRYKVGCSDNPYSLMLGLAGDLVAELDFMQDGKSGFPGYEL